MTAKLMRPSSIIGQYFVVTIGANIYSIVVNAFILFAIVPTLNLQIPFNPIFLIPATGVFLIRFFIFFAANILLGSLAFWLKQIAPLIETRSVLYPFLARALVLLPTNKFTFFLLICHYLLAFIIQCKSI